MEFPEKADTITIKCDTRCNHVRSGGIRNTSRLSLKNVLVASVSLQLEQKIYTRNKSASSDRPGRVFRTEDEIPGIAAKAQTTLAPEKGRGPLAGRIGGVLRLFPEFATEEIIRKGRRGPWGAAFPVLTKGPRSGKDRRRPIPEYE